MRLVARATRSVGLTEAGTRFVARLGPAFDQIDEALESLGDVRGRPSGLLRLTMLRTGGKPTAWVRRTSSRAWWRRAWQRSGSMRVLDRYCPRFPGYFLYYPSRVHLAPKLKALVDFLKRTGR